MDFKILVGIMLGSAIVNNYVLRKFLAVCPFLGVSKEIKSSLGMSFAVIFVMVMAAAATWPIHHFILHVYGLGYMRTVVFIICIATLVQLVEIALRRYFPPLFQALGVYLPLMTTNCAVLALTITNINEEYTYIESLVNALGAGLGFLLAMVLFTGLRTSIDNADPPAPFKGMPITLITAAILSLSFFGFGGVIENLFG